MNENSWNLKLLAEVGNVMTDSSICGLGQAAANPLVSVIKYFPNEIKSI
jgi:formate dehydrogenase